MTVKVESVLMNFAVRIALEREVLADAGVVDIEGTASLMRDCILQTDKVI